MIPCGCVPSVVAGQGRRSATGERFTAIIVGGLRRYRGIPAYELPADPPDGELLPIARAAEVLSVAPSTLHRWLSDGFVAGEQDTPGAPWRIRAPSASRARPCCSVSGAASSKPFTSAADAERA